MRVSLIIWLVAAMLLQQQQLPVTAAATAVEQEQIEPKIVGGTSISITQAPYQVSVRLTSRDRKSYGSGHICGGVVISQRLVATAAHCVYNNDKKQYRRAGEFMLVMGNAYLLRKNENTLQYYVQELIVHPNYNQVSLVNDIALMFFNGYIPWEAPTVKALNLNDRSLPAGTNCAVTGWGVVFSGATISSPTLQLGRVPLVSYEQCFIGYGNLPRSQVCAGFMKGGVDACQGDSGGPLQCENQLVGIVSYGEGCAKRNYPGVYTNVSFYHDWIVQMNSTLNYTIYKNSAKSFGASSVWSLLLSVVALLVLANC